MRKSKKMTAGILGALTLVMVTGSAMAYFTDSEQAKNHITIGKVDISLTEPNWDKVPDKEKENIKENSLSTDSGELFDFDDAWKKTFSIYPKKTAYSTSKTAWMDKVLEVIEENQPDIARLLYKATEAYLSDYQEKNPDDTDFRYIPKYVDWLKNDCDYWLQIAEKRGDCS